MDADLLAESAFKASIEVLARDQEKSGAGHVLSLNYQEYKFIRMKFERQTPKTATLTKRLPPHS